MAKENVVDPFLPRFAECALLAPGSIVSGDAVQKTTTTQPLPFDLAFSVPVGYLKTERKETIRLGNEAYTRRENDESPKRLD